MSSAFVALLQAQTNPNQGLNQNKAQNSLQYKTTDDIQSTAGASTPEVERRINHFSDDHPATYTTMQREKAKNAPQSPYYREGQPASTAYTRDTVPATYSNRTTPISKSDTIPLRNKTTEINNEVKYTNTSLEKSVDEQVDEINNTNRNGLIKTVSDEETADRPISRLFMTNSQHKEYKAQQQRERELRYANAPRDTKYITTNNTTYIGRERIIDTVPQYIQSPGYTNYYYGYGQQPYYQQQQQSNQQQPFYYTNNPTQQGQQYKSGEANQQQQQMQQQIPAECQKYLGQGLYGQSQQGFQQNPQQQQFVQPHDMQQRQQYEQRLGYQQQPSVYGQQPQQQYGYNYDFMRQQNPYQEQFIGQPRHDMGMYKSGQISQSEQMYGPYQQMQHSGYMQPSMYGRMSQQEMYGYGQQHQMPYMQQHQGQWTNLPSYYTCQQQSMYPYGYQQGMYQNPGMQHNAGMYHSAGYQKSSGIYSPYDQPSMSGRFYNPTQESEYYRELQDRLDKLEESERSTMSRPNYYNQLSKRERRRLERRNPNGIYSNREVGYRYANPDNATKVYTISDLEKRMENRSQLGKVQESKLAVENYVFPSASIVIPGKANKVQREWRKFLREESGVKVKRKSLRNSAFHKDKNARYFKAEGVRINEVTEKPGDLLTVFQKEKGHVRMDVAYKLGYQVGLSPEGSSRQEFRNLESLVKRFAAENASQNSKQYMKSIDKQIRQTNKELKKEERKLSKMERTYEKRNKKGKADSYEALAVDLQRKTTESLKKDIASFEYMKMSFKNRNNDIYLDKFHRN